MVFNILNLSTADQIHFLNASLKEHGIDSVFSDSDTDKPHGRPPGSYERRSNVDFSVRVNGVTEKVRLETRLTFFRHSFSSANYSYDLSTTHVPALFTMIQRPYFLNSPNRVNYNAAEIASAYREVYENASSFLDREGIFSEENVLKLILLTSTRQFQNPVRLENPYSAGLYMDRTATSRTQVNIDTQLEYVFRGYTLEDVLFIELFNVDMDYYDEAAEMPFEWKVNLLTAGKNPFNRRYY